MPRSPRAMQGRRAASYPHDRELGQLVLAALGLDLPEAEPAVRLRRIPCNRRALGHRARRGLRKDERLRRVVLDVRGLEVMLLVDVPIEHGRVPVRHEELNGLIAVARRPVPLRVEREERPVREYDDAAVARLLGEVRGEPGELLVADAARRIGDVVERDEVHALMREAVVRRTEELAIRLAVIERGIVLAGHEADLFRAQAGDQLLELRAAPAPLGRIVGGAREIAGENDEVGLW